MAPLPKSFQENPLIMENFPVESRGVFVEKREIPNNAWELECGGSWSRI